MPGFIGIPNNHPELLQQCPIYLMCSLLERAASLSLAPPLHPVMVLCTEPATLKVLRNVWQLGRLLLKRLGDCVVHRAVLRPIAEVECDGVIPPLCVADRGTVYRRALYIRMLQSNENKLREVPRINSNCEATGFFWVCARISNPDHEATDSCLFVIETCL